MTRVSATKTWLWLGLTLWSTLAAASGWSPAASMSRYRYYHTATLLPSGRVLVTGGSSSGGATDTTETYNPATNTWSPTANLRVARSGHTATRLLSGRVLIAGGASTAVHASAELYNPNTNTFSPTGAMVTARRGHKAVLLPSGQVLAVAGYGTTAHTSALQSAELYNPSTGRWTATGSLTTASGSVTATLLDDGRVLAINDDGLVAAAEVYNPASGTWTRVSDPPAFYGHAAVLTDFGAVLATGQETTWYDSGAWLYFPEDDYWEYVSYANETRRRGHSLTLLPSGRVLVARGTRNQIGGSTELWDPQSWGLYTVAYDSPTTGHTATLLSSGQVLVVGGTSQEEPEWYSSAELFTDL
ncbi:Kelch repeat-containing protein [Pyxidicoccus sp. 3LFB2]